MDYGRLLEDIQTLRGQFLSVSERQNAALDELKTVLHEHYDGLEQNNAALKDHLEQSLRQQADEQRAALESARQAQVDFAKSHSEHLEALEQAQSQLHATAEAAIQAAQAAAGQTMEQGQAIAALKKNAEEESRSFQQQIANNREATAAKIAELHAVMGKMDASKPIGDMHKRLDLMQTETTHMLNSLGGQVEAMKRQLEQTNESQRTVSRIREEMERLSKRADKLEQTAKELNGDMREMASQRVVASDGTVVSVPRRMEKKSPLPMIAIVLSAVAILGMILGGILLKSGQDRLANQIEQQLLPPQATFSAQLNDLSAQVKELSVLAHTTPAPTPTPTPVPTEAPTATPNAEATPK